MASEHILYFLIEDTSMQVLELVHYYHMKEATVCFSDISMSLIITHFKWCLRIGSKK